MAAILIAAHFVPYINSYFGYFLRLFSLPPTIISSLIIAMVMLVLLILLTITSFNAVKKRIDAGRWKALQKLAYPFFALILLHLLGYLIIPVQAGSTTAILQVIIYLLIFISYTVLRIRRTMVEKRKATGEVSA